MIIDKDKRILVIRYGTNIVKDCIEKHIEIVNDLGFCWFAKLGRMPSKKILDEIFGDSESSVILYSKSGIYSCIATEVSIQRPQSGEPEYYEKNIYDAKLNPSMYIKLVAITKIHASDIADLVVSSSRNHLMDTLARSMNSFFVVESPDYGKRKAEKSNNTTKSEKKLPSNDCVFRKDGLCSRRGCVNYKYECIRPSTCLKQKR